MNTCESSRSNSDVNSSEGDDNDLCTGLCLPVRGGEGEAIVGAGVEGENLLENKLIVQLFHQDHHCLFENTDSKVIWNYRMVHCHVSR